MARLEISLLGPVHVTHNGQPFPERTYAKVLALLAYVSVESDRPHPRATVATLLWPEQTDDRARHSLRQAISTLRRVVGDRSADEPVLLITRDTIAFNHKSDYLIDIGTFDRLARECDQHGHQRVERCPPCIQRIERAVALYRGAFLNGFSVGDSVDFDDWIQVWQQRLQSQLMQMLATIASWYEGHGDYGQASLAIRRQLEFEPWREDAYRQLMSLLWRGGERSAALAQYERCRKALEAELGVEPEDETIALYERIRASAVDPSHATTGPMNAGYTARVPVPPTKLVGRQRELEEIADLLAHRDCRLLTLTGPGGSGKTRLAIQSAAGQIREYDGNVCFVSLAPVRQPDGIVPAIAAALDLNLHGTEHAELQLFDWMRERSMLLVLDNAEHLVDGMHLVSRMLAAAPGVTLLITSRERLNLSGEWVYEVRGLDVPRGDATDSFEGYGAVELLGDRLRQVRSGRPLRHEERPEIVQICQLVDGLPLALELAAAWAPTLTLDQIAGEIRRNLDFLSTSMRDMPDRHRSMRAVFQQTWDMMTEDEQAAYRRLSAFRDGFLLPAAEEVAGTSARDLATLIGKSLLTQQGRGRYRLHELLRQYGEEMLRQDAADFRDVHVRHCRYYLRLLSEQDKMLIGRDQQATMNLIEADIGNIRSAWTWGVERHMVEETGDASHALWLFYVVRGWMREGAHAFGAQVEALEQDVAAEQRRSLPVRFALATSLVRCGGFQSGLGHYDRGITMLDRGITMLRGLEAQQELGVALNMLAAALRMKGAYLDARTSLEESLVRFRNVDNRWGVAFSLNDLGMIAHVLGHNTEAYRSCAESRTMFRQIGDKRGHAFAAYNLGLIATRAGDYDRANRLHHESLTLRQQCDDRWGVAASLVQLGVVARLVGSRQESRALLVKALGIAWNSSVAPVVLEALVELSALSIEDGEVARARDILVAITAHPAVHGGVQGRVVELMNSAEFLGPATASSDRDNRWAIEVVDDFARSLVEQR